MPRKNKGRQKVEMAKMSNESNLQVTFSKRRSGLFKKASELCTLCGAEVAVIVFSPGRKVFSFGHPCVDMIIDRFNSQNPPPRSSGTVQVINAYRNANIRELNMELTKVLGELEFEKKRGEELNRLRKASEDRFWWESPVEGLSLAQLDQLKASLVELRKDVTKHAENTMILSSRPHFLNPLQFANPHQFPNPSQFFIGSSSGSGGGFPPVDGPDVNNPGSDSKMNLKGLNNSGNGSGFH